jgi:hypothetical protein
MVAGNTCRTRFGVPIALDRTVAYADGDMLKHNLRSLRAIVLLASDRPK